MSSQHRNLAAVWEHLAGRTDISDTLREITGHHALQSALHEDEHGHADDASQTIVWIKTIFDLQRCYLSGISSSTSGCPPNLTSCLLPPELLFSSILYLLEVKIRSFPSQTSEITSDLTLPRLVLAQTILSGVRLLLSRRENLSSRQIERLKSAIKKAWDGDNVDGVERFITKELFATILELLEDSSHVDSHQTERAKARLPTYATGLYPLDIRPETFVTPLVQAISEEDDDWLDAYWVLFDSLWAVECAIIQRYVTIRRQLGVVEFDQVRIGSDEVLEQLDQQRTGLIISIFHITGPMMPSKALLESLATTLLDWNEDLDSFLSRQDSLLQHRTSLRPSHTRSPSYGKLVSISRPYFETATINFSTWLSKRKPREDSVSAAKAGMTAEVMQDTVKEWVARMSPPNAKSLSQGMDESFIPVYMVNCQKLHVIPKWWLAEQLRWCDKWAYESVQENSPLVNWKDGIKCPSCTSGGSVNCARLIEPLQQTTNSPKILHQHGYNSSQHSVEVPSSYGTTSSSAGSHSISDGGTRGSSHPSQTTMTVSIPTSGASSELERSKSAEAQLPQYTESPISPFTQIPLTRRARSYGFGMPDYPISPLNESLNVPIPTKAESRLSSSDLPIPVDTPPTRNSIYEKVSLSAPSNLTDSKPVTLPNSLPSSLPSSVPNAVTWNEASITKSKPASRGIKIANSIRRKSSGKEKDSCALPKEPIFVFSSSGHSLLLWGKTGNFVTRFDISSKDTTTIQCCRFEVGGVVAAAAAGHRKCVVVASDASSTNRLLAFTGINVAPAGEIELEFGGRIADICVAMSSDDTHVAVSINGLIELFRLENGVKRIAFHHQMDVYELRGGVSHRRSIPMTRTTSPDAVAEELKPEHGSWFSEQSKSLSSKEVAEEQQRQTVIITRKLYFSTDSHRLIVATQLGDHCVYVDVWDVTREPVSTISEHSRSFKLPPWTLNDGDLTGVFYDSSRRAALVTAFLGKEYPVLVPFPGYEPLQNETFSTKIISAAQSPSGSTFIVANGMTEIIQFQYTAKGTLAPHRLKKSSSKISTSVFKPGHLALAMPQENCLRAFWIKDGKCMLRSINVGTTETIKDIDIRSHYDRLMSLKERPIIASAPSLDIPELDAGDFI
ncbi:hypothetical protein BKA66DRAFT_457420 [Pyrenochaeta sp. MPI-SDFR-AT-0127]|nr:hypothetical protein BKA66DRAFT_457420 [Pyrenochaeta sp. MPI-SDFR-AT-0127]